MSICNVIVDTPRGTQRKLGVNLNWTLDKFYLYIKTLTGESCLSVCVNHRKSTREEGQRLLRDFGVHEHSVIKCITGIRVGHFAIIETI